MLLFVSVGDLAGDRCWEQGSPGASLKEVCGSIVIGPCLWEDSVLKSSPPVDDKDVCDNPSHTGGVCWGKSSLTRSNY